jgi:hypothetical protein
VLDAAYRRHEAEVVAIFSDPGLLALQDEPRYKALAARIHFPMQPPLTPINSARDRDNPHLASLNGLR